MKRTKLTSAILKSNRPFSAALVLIYTLAMSLLVMSCFFSGSIDATFSGFFDAYGMPDAYIYTAGTPFSLAQELEKTEGVKRVSEGMVTDLSTELPSGLYTSLRYIGLSSGGICMADASSGERVTVSEDTVAVSAVFAEHNGLHPGSVLILSGGREITVTDVVSTPETIATVRSGSDWYDESTFGYVYLPEEVLEDILGTEGIVNRFCIYFEDDADEEDLLETIMNTGGLGAVSSQLYRGSFVEKQLDASIEGARKAVTYLPGFIALISILAATLFMSQIIRNSKKMIGLLMTLGFSSGNVMMVFIRYSLLLTMISSVLGGGAGAVLLKSMLGIYRSVYHMPFTVIEGNLTVLLFVFASVQLIGVIACLLSGSGISSADPAVIVSGPDDGGKLPSFIRRMRSDSFAKITWISMYRSRKRILISTLCCIACLCLNHVSVGIIHSKNEGLDALFSDRLGYDIIICCDSEEALEKTISLPQVLKAEKRIAFSTEYDGEVMRIETLTGEETMTRVIDTEYVRAVPGEEGILIEEGFARRHGIEKGSVIDIDGVKIEVTGITREYLYPVMYISLSEAEDFGYDSYNSAAIVLRDGKDEAGFTKQASRIEGYGFMYSVSSREDNARSTLDQLDMPCVLFVIIAMIIGVVIISNMNIISIRERSREYATLLVLGTGKEDFLKMSLTEAGIDVLFFSVPGIPLSLFLSKMILKATSSVSQEYVLEDAGLITVISLLMVTVYILIGVFITQRYIARMNVLDELNARQ